MLHANSRSPRFARAREFWGDTSGSNMVELAICLLFVVLCILGVMECSRALYVEHSISSVTRDAARYAMVRGSSWSGTTCALTTTYSCDATAANVTSYINNDVPPGVSTSSLVISTTWLGVSAAGTACDTTEGSNSPGCIVNVKVIYPFTFLLPAPNSTTIQFSSSATMTITQ